MLVDFPSTSSQKLKYPLLSMMLLSRIEVRHADKNHKPLERLYFGIRALIWKFKMIIKCKRYPLCIIIFK